MINNPNTRTMNDVDKFITGKNKNKCLNKFKNTLIKTFFRMKQL